MTPHHDPVLGALYALCCLAASVRLRLAPWRARLWATIALAAGDRARAAIADAQQADR